ncbi:MAG: branched-chain amino acid aminotransferase [Steroidobacteraceae bacterium]|nr:branched-chain amino acid aminotransferase [Nevskiaceae bacterium]MCP5340117.1 branched-chain amino acid aminotransferase [Nevskiaceae bacterium]MCP5360930.1 branched-chain amino acid aminotransferase [Nevskiaceae bacterium]MCP5472462.1 branched-chain amino acid aminotransferase [Nevskiaceae bacterium]
MNPSRHQNAPFGSILTDKMAIATYRDGAWSEAEIRVTGPLEIHPAAHALHYGSSCFEGFKAYRRADGSVHIFRMDRHVARMMQSARALVLPEPDPARLTQMVTTLVDRCRGDIPDAPGALYLRPLLFGTLPNIGAAATPSTEAVLVVLASPVWDYFAGGMKPLKILVEEHAQRCAPHLGVVKTGGNYAAAMGPTLAARKAHGVDQVLFCPGGEVQETGAANFLMIRDGELLTRSLDSSFLHGVTRDSLLVLARDLGYRVTERVFRVDEMLQWAQTGEAALSGTAAVLAGVGTLVREGVSHQVGDGSVGPETRKLREALVAIQQGEAPDRHGWLTRV